MCMHACVSSQCVSEGVFERVWVYVMFVLLFALFHLEWQFSKWRCSITSDFLINNHLDSFSVTLLCQENVWRLFRRCCRCRWLFDVGKCVGVCLCVQCSLPWHGLLQTWRMQQLISGFLYFYCCLPNAHTYTSTLFVNGHD